MIVKMRQLVPGLKQFVQWERSVMAKRIMEDFVIESERGWDKGKRGDWLVCVNSDLWIIVADVQFQRLYKPFDIAMDLKCVSCHGREARWNQTQNL